MPYYLDHGAYATSLGATPTWGVPQEGDGSATTAATAGATAGVVFTANAAATNTFTVCGVVFTAVASGATGNQFNVGAALTNTLDNLVAAINASTTTVASGVAVGTPQLRNLVFARNTSGTTLEVMMRVGSATLNGATNTNCRATASGWTSSSTLPVDFSGGSGGCWGLLFNTAAIGVSSSLAALAYGLMVMAVPLVAVASTALTTAATPTTNDVIYCRTGAGQTITCAANGTPNLSTPNYPQHLVFDSNTIWTGDSGTGVITVSMSISSADNTLRLVSNTNGVPKSIRAIMTGGLRFLWATSNGGGAIYIAINPGGGSRTPAMVEGITFETPSTYNTGGAGPRIFAGSQLQYAFRFKRCNFLFKEARTSWSGLVLLNGIDGAVIFEGCEVTANHTAGSDPGSLVQSTAIAAGGSLKFIGLRLSGWAFGRYRIFPASMTMGSGSEAVAEGCTGVNLGTTYVGLSSLRTDNPNYATVITQNLDAGLGYRYEYGAGVVDWNPDASPAYPTRSALLGDNSTPWSVKMDWFASAASVFNNLTTPRMATICRLSSTTRTVALDFLTPVTVTALDVAMRVYYISTDNKVYCETTYGKSSALSSPGATWAGISNFPSHSSRRLSLTTSLAIKQGTEVAVYFEVTGNPPGGSGVQLYIDPETSIT